MEAELSSETLAHNCNAIWHNNPEDYLYSHIHENIKYYVLSADSVFELDSSTESAEASPEVNHRVRRSGVMARRGTPSR